MRTVRWLMVAVTGVFGASLLQATVVQGPAGPNFTIGISGWDPDQEFTAMTNTDASSDDFESGTTGVCLSEDCDPNIKFNLGGDATSVGQTFTFSADSDGGGNFDFINAGPPINNVLITTEITPDQQNEVFTCSSDAFSFCGFADPNEQLEIFFSNPVLVDGIPTTAPEPASYALLLIACGAIVAVHRVRSARASA